MLQTEMNKLNSKLYTKVYYCPVAIMKKFVHQMLHFHWLRSPWQRADISGIACHQDDGFY